MLPEELLSSAVNFLHNYANILIHYIFIFP